MSEYKVLSPIRQGEEVYYPGELIELEDADAKELAAIGAVERGSKSAKAASAESGSSDPEATKPTAGKSKKA